MVEVENKISEDVLEKMKEHEEIEVVLSLKEISDKTLSEIRELGEIIMIVQLTKHILVRTSRKKIKKLAEKPYIQYIDTPKTIHTLLNNKINK